MSRTGEVIEVEGKPLVTIPANAYLQTESRENRMQKATVVMTLETPQVHQNLLPQPEAKVTSLATAMRQKQADAERARLLLLSIRLQIMQKPD